MNEKAAEEILDLMYNATDALASIRLEGWCDEVGAIVPQNPVDFADYVHFVEALYVAYRHWIRYLQKQQSHNQGDLLKAEAALHALVTKVRGTWEQYKANNGITAKAG